MKKLISIIVPLYNSENYIERCIKSIQNQNYSEIEIIVVNDGSTDRSLDKVKELSKYDNRIKIINKQNEGVSKARNIGIEYSKGDYIMFIDSDDWIESETISRILEENEKINAEYIKFAYIVEEKDFSKNSKLMFKDIINFSKENLSELYDKLIYTYELNQVWGALIKRDLIISNNIRFDENYRYAEDYKFNLDLITKVKNFLYIPEHFYHYFYNSNGIVRSFNVGKLKNDMEACVVIYNSLNKYITIWGINNEKYKKDINKRVLKETEQITDRMYRYPNKLKYNVKKENMVFLNEVLNKQEIETKNNFKLNLIKNRKYFITNLIYLVTINLKSRIKYFIKIIRKIGER